MIHEVQMGKRTRQSFARIEEALAVPDLIEVQKNSYKRFLDVDLKEVLADVSPITDYNDSLMLEFVDYKLDDTPKNSIERCKERDQTYAAPLKVTVRLTNRETQDVRQSDVFIGDFPLMTEHGTFIINGAERVIVSQLVRSPGVYYERAMDKSGKYTYATKMIPNRGAWLEYECDANDQLWVRIDRTRKVPMTVLLRALGCGTNAEIYDLLGEDERLDATIAHDPTNSEEKALEEIYRKLRPGEPATVDSGRNLLHMQFFDPKRYDLARVGRYKYNKKLALAARITGKTLEEDVANPYTGEVLATAGQTLTEEQAVAIQNAGVNMVRINQDNRILNVVGNHFANFDAFMQVNEPELYARYQSELASRLAEGHPAPDLYERVYVPSLVEVLDAARADGSSLVDAINENITALIPKHVLVDDIIASMSYQITLPYGVGNLDDIDHLGNRRLRSVGELLQNQIRVGLARLERIVRERMSTQDPAKVRPQDLINIRPMAAAIKEFFGSSQLSQFMDQPNPLAELTHKRRLSALGPGGLNRDRASFEVRDVHYSHYGRICPIETPEGPNIGLIGSLATYARINEYGFIEAPYRRIDKATSKVLDEIVYMTADEEDRYVIAQASEAVDKNNCLINDRVTVRIRDEITEVERHRVDYIDVSPRQLVSVATGMIPFLENDDATRALMGSNMQRQAVPLLIPEAPIVGTGIEYKAACDSGVVMLAKRAGTVERVSANQIVIRTDDGEIDQYNLTKYARSNQGTCINQRPQVIEGEYVRQRQVIADGPSTDQGEIALGHNVLIAFMTWEGYNYEDAVLISERLVKEDVYTSIHIEEYESEARDTKLGPEEITRDIPNVGDDALKDLDERGIIRVGAEVRAGDILVGKVTPKGETELTAEERLLRAIFGEKAREVRDTSLRVPHGEFGIIVDVKELTRENHDEMAPGVNRVVRVYIAQKRKIQVGDKMAGRHGNKGVVSRVLREEDMPFMPDGTPIDIVLNPLGVPSRMNIGQVLEVHLGLAAKALGWHIATPVFDGATQEDIQECLRQAAQVKEPSLIDENGRPVIQFSKCGLDVDGKIQLYDGRTGDPFDHKVTVGYMYYLKLHHLVDDKIHARSTGPYSLITQQPLGGKAQFGGQRFGEMEVWALYAYGASHVLQEILTVKSDDMVGRVKTFEAIVKGENIPEPGIPESFRVLVKELQSLGLDIRVLDRNRTPMELTDNDDDVQETQEPVIAPVEEAMDFDLGDEEEIDDEALDEFDIDSELDDIENDDFGDF
ncbi:MAG: DNA-directed RNA polymerase subunit beta [Clostridia bacterium]|nr:DNA-directed RNA polymerase subunit beta [Clostridia bacterium]